ncbi:MAG TPA: 30S ribosomal protein S2 [Anaerolineales bacterium]|nr:30S ribosomal protein S2 [Anaerolineales bacterium]
MSVISMKALLESGVHFGHRTHKWNPRMKPYIFTERNGIHIINLQQTVKSLDEAYDVIRETVAAGGNVLFVGTKRQAQETVQQEAIRCGMPHVTARWLGGMLTNWRTIRERINELDRLERMRDRGDFERLTKKEGLMLSREIEKLDTRLGGIRKMVQLPELLFAVDVRREETAIHEANLLNIPIVAMVDTNCDPTNIDYVIPSNDDAIRAIKLIVGKIAEAVMEGRGLRKEEDLEAEAAMAAAVAAAAEEPELADEDLLGAATLAKIKGTSKPEDEDDSDIEDEDKEDEEEDDIDDEDKEDEDDEKNYDDFDFDEDEMSEEVLVDDFVDDDDDYEEE